MGTRIGLVKYSVKITITITITRSRLLTIARFLFSFVQHEPGMVGIDLGRTRSTGTYIFTGVKISRFQLGIWMKTNIRMRRFPFVKVIDVHVRYARGRRLQLSRIRFIRIVDVFYSYIEVVFFFTSAKSRVIVNLYMKW